MNKRKLYGVGVGPGSPDLMTLRAIQILNQVDVIVVPQSSPHVKSVAWRIVESHLEKRQEQEYLHLTFPMSKDPEKTVPAWGVALKKIDECLEEGKSVAFISQGDPLFYSTFVYLMNHAKQYWPDTEVEVVPSVSSLMAVPSIVGIPIADGQEKVAIVPASYDIETLPAILKMFDTVFLMKVSSVMPRLIKILEEAELLDRAVYVSRATMDGQRIVTDLRSIKDDRCDYFSMVMVAKQERSGILMGESGAENLAQLTGEASGSKEPSGVQSE